MLHKSDKSQTNSTLLKFYNHYEHLATKYAKDIFSSERIGFTFDDLLQEFKIKIYTTIIAYAEKYNSWKETGRNKPVPIEIYIKSALQNRKKDFIKQISENPVKGYISIEADGFDYSVYDTIDSEMKFTRKECVCVINGIDLLQGLTLRRKRCFMLYLRGYKLNFLNNTFKEFFVASDVIRKQIEMLRQKGGELTENFIHTCVQYSVAEKDN